MMNLGQAPQPPRPVSAVSGPGGGAGQQGPPGSPPGGMPNMMSSLAGQGPVGMSGDPNATLRNAMVGIEQLSDAVKSNPQLIEILAAVMKTHPTLRLVFLAASRHPEAKAQAVEGKAGLGTSAPPILGR